MKEYVYVEFIFHEDDVDAGEQMLSDLGEDFVRIRSETEWDYEDPSDAEFYHRVSGKINSMVASILKLKHPFLAEKMRISYIPDSLKDKYRQSR